ncbi:MAG: rod shape-determining protein MreD [Bacilli bacterium]|nr:rod shape-determining protein MreD [Bacilli bacterium]
MIPYIIMILSLLLDGFLTNHLPYLVNNLSLLTPLLTLISILIIFPFYQKNHRKYFITVFILGIIYDLFYTDLIFFNAVLFLIIAWINVKVQRWTTPNALNLLLQAIGMIILYESFTGIILYAYNMVPVTIDKVFYKITHSLLLNIVYVELLYFIIKIIPKKYKKISIN